MKHDKLNHLFELAFTSTEGTGVKYRFHQEADGSSTLILENTQDAPFAEEVARAYGFARKPDHLYKELAFAGAVELSNAPDIVAAQYEAVDDSESCEEDTGDETTVDDEDDGSEVATVTVNKDGTVSFSVAGNVKIIGDHLKMLGSETAGSISHATPDEELLKVIDNPDMLKFANKVFDMISPGEDKSKYAMFLYNFDDFLFMHRSEDYEEEQQEDEVVMVPMVQPRTEPYPHTHQPYNPALEVSSENKPFTADQFVKMFNSAEVASSFLSAFADYLPAEIAKKKNHRSALLSILMKAMSGEHGIDAVNAWAGGSKEGVAASLAKVVEQVVSSVPDKSEEGGA